MTTENRIAEPPAALRWAPVLWAAYAQCAAFTAAIVLAFVATDAAATFATASAARLWPPAALALGLVAAANAARRVGALGPAKYTGSLSLAGLAVAGFAAALAPSALWLTAAGFAMGVAGGLAVAIAGRVLAAAQVGDGSASVALSSLAVVAALVGGTVAVSVLPAFGWRGVLGLSVVAAALAAWKFAEAVPRE